MKIGFAGAHRTGKTTLAKSVAESLDVKFISGSGTPSFEKHGAKPTDDLPFSKRFLIQDDIVGRWEEQTKEQSDFVTDRTPLDFIAYLVSELSTAEFKRLSKIGHTMLNAYIEECMELLLSLDMVFFVPPSIPIEQDDSKALCDKIMIDRISASIGGYAEQSDHPGIFIIDSELTELDHRVHQVLGFVDRYKAA